MCKDAPIYYKTLFLSVSISFILHLFFFKIFQNKTIFTKFDTQTISISAQITQKRIPINSSQKQATKQKNKQPKHISHLYEKENNSLSPTMSPQIASPIKWPTSSHQANQAHQTSMLNFISHITLPKSLLKQNLFPRKYHALFELQIKSEKEFQVQFIHLESLQSSFAYLDAVVTRAFLKRLDKVSKIDLKEFLMAQLDNQDENNLAPLENRNKQVLVTLEFNEEGF